MPLKTLVKVSHLSNLSDARYCSGMGVEMLGFSVIEGSEYYMAPKVFQDIRGWISGPRIIAEIYGIKTETDIGSIIQTYAPDYFELSYEEYEHVANSLSLPCIVSISHRSQIEALTNKGGVRYLIAEETMSCDDVSASAYPVLVKATSIQRLHEHLSEGCFKGFVLESRYESRPGVTNYDQLGVVLEALDEES
jgi:phosphoribosylanthranilate isomerase